MKQDERRLFAHMGGEIREIIEELSGHIYQHCGTEYEIGIEANINGYPYGEAGYQDEHGNWWWPYVTCPDCGYDSSVQNNLNADLPYHSIDF